MAKETKAELLAREAANQSYSKRVLCLLQNAGDCGFELVVVDDGFSLEDEDNGEIFHLPYFFSEKGHETLEMLEDEIGCGPNWEQGDQEEGGQFAFDATFNDDHLYIDVNGFWEAVVKEARRAAAEHPRQDVDAELQPEWIGQLSDFVKPNKTDDIPGQLYEKLQAIEVRVSRYSVDYFDSSDNIIYFHKIEALTFTRHVEYLLKDIVSS